MTTDANEARWAQTHRRLRAFRNAALITLLVAPLAQATWAVHLAGERGPNGALGIGSPASATSPAAQAYFADRSPVVDELLPAGSGGTRFYQHLGGAAGMAFINRAAIGLSAEMDLSGFPEAVELHERAHLAHAFLPEAVAALLARLPAPHADEYAATDAGEHFAEMAAQAWTMVAPPKLFCVDRTPEALEAIETRVPGTAGFVVRFLRLGGFTEPAIGGTALRLSAPYRAELDAIWAAIDARRRPGGGFVPWRHQTIRRYLESQQTMLRTSGRWFDRVVVWVMYPSVLVARLVD